jgi:predicted ATPase
MVDRGLPLCVGREAELERLEEALAAAAESRGGLMLLTGDAGIGKTRLSEAVAALASGRGLSAVWGRCCETGGAPAYWPWIEALRTLAAERGGTAPGGRRAGRRARGRSVGPGACRPRGA